MTQDVRLMQSDAVLGTPVLTRGSWSFKAEEEERQGAAH